MNRKTAVVKKNRLKTGLAFLLPVLYLNMAMGQQDPITLFDTEKPLVSLEAQGNLFYWDARPTDDSLPTIVKNHYESLNKGLRYGGSVLFHFDEGLTFGVTYLRFQTEHTTPKAHWLINGGPRYGTVKEQIHFNFFGLRGGKQFPVYQSLWIDARFGVGTVHYTERGDFVGFKTLIEGSSLGIDLNLAVLYRMDMNWAAFAQGSLFNSVLVQPNYSDPNTPSQPIAESLSITNLSMGIGLRYTFLQKNKKKDKKRQPNRFPKGGDSERFKL